MKKCKLFLILPILLLITLIIVPLSVNVKGSNTLDFTFENDEIFSTTNPTIDSNFNLRNQTIYTEIYNATYSFYKETGLESTAIDFVDVDDSGVGATVEVITNVYAHDEVLKLSAVDPDDANVKNNFSSGQESGTVEFWINSEDVSYRSWIYIMDDIDQGIIFLFETEKIKYNDGTLYDVQSALDDIWYHFSIDFECGAGSYKGLSADTYYLSVNGKRYGAYNYHTATDELDFFKFLLNHEGRVYTTYFDAIGYSWDVNYSINDNVIPYNYKNNTIEIDKWEFGYNSDGTPSQEDTTPPFWSGTNVLTVRHDLDMFEDRVAIALPATTTSNRILQKSFSGLENGIREIYWNTYIEELSFSTETQYTDYNIYSDDDTLIFGIRLIINAAGQTIYYYNYSAASYISLGNYECDATYSYLVQIYNSIVYLNVNNTEYILKTGINKEGIGKLLFQSRLLGNIQDPYDPVIVYIDSVGLYINGTSQSTDYANYYYNMNTTFNNKHHNLFNLNATGYFSCSITQFEAIDPYVFNIFTFQNVSSISFINTYDYATKNIVNAYLTITTNSSVDYIINYINIAGPKLTEGINDYYPIITSNNILNNESYFYVDSNNRLQYTLIVNDNNTEYIQAVFDITDISCEDRNIKFSSDINGNAYGFFSVGYSDSTASVIEIPYYSTKTSVILPQIKIVDKFLILITDNDLTNNTVCTGYISNISLIYNPDIVITIITLTLIEMIVPLIVMILPSIVMSKKFGIPGVIVTFILMSLICVIANLIPVWLFLIIAFGSIGLLLVRKQIGDVK